MSGRLDIGHRLNDSLPPKMTQAVSASPGGQSAISQLKRFGRAKAKINSIYEEILAYGCDVSKFLHSFADQKEARDEANDQLHVVPEDCAGRAENYNKQLEAINAVLKRDHMKVIYIFSYLGHLCDNFFNILIVIIIVSVKMFNFKILKSNKTEKP